MIYLFYGEEDFLIQQEIDRFKKQVPPDSFSFNFDFIEDGDVDRLVNSVNSLPMLSDKKLIVAKNVACLKAEKEKDDEGETEEKSPRLSRKDKEAELLLSVLKGLSDKVTLIFITETVDKRKKLFKFMEKHGEAREFKPFTEWEEGELKNRVEKKFKSLGKKVEEDALETLIEVCGRNLRQLNSEVEKIVTYIGDKGLVEKDDILKTASSGQVVVFSLLKALREKNLVQALSDLERLLKDGEYPVQLLQLLTSQYRIMLQAKFLLQKGVPFRDVPYSISASPFFVKRCLEGVKSFGLDELKEDMFKLHFTDLKLKTTSQKPGLLLELLLVDLCDRERVK